MTAEWFPEQKEIALATRQSVLFVLSKVSTFSQAADFSGSILFW